MKKRLQTATIGLIILTFISKILGFVRELVISYIYGTTAMSDAYSMANSIAILIVTGLAMGIMTAYIPESMLIAEEDRRNEFFNNLINAVLLICGIISIICIIFVKPIVSVIGIGFSDETKRYTEILLCFVMIASVCIFLIYTISGFLNTKKNFYYNGVQLIITNFIVIIAVMLSKESPVKLGMGYLMAYIIPLILGLLLMKQYNFKYKRILDFQDKHLRKICTVSIIAFLGTNVIKLNVMLDRVFASILQEGAVAAINYAFTLTSIVPEVFSLSMITVLYPELSELFVKEEYTLFEEKIVKLLKQTILILVPITVFFLAEGDWLVQALFQRGAFDEQATNMTVQVLKGYSLGMLPIGISFILCKVYFARKEALVPTVCLGISILINAVLDFILVHRGLMELTAVTTISIALATFAMLWILIKKGAICNIKKILKVFFKSIFAACFMAALIIGMRKYCMTFYEQSGMVVQFLLLAGITFISGLSYIVCMIILKEETLLDELEKIKHKF